MMLCSCVRWFFSLMHCVAVFSQEVAGCRADVFLAWAHLLSSVWALLCSLLCSLRIRGQGGQVFVALRDGGSGTLPAARFYRGLLHSLLLLGRLVFLVCSLSLSLSLSLALFVFVSVSFSLSLSFSFSLSVCLACLPCLPASPCAGPNGRRSARGLRSSLHWSDSTITFRYVDGDTSANEPPTYIEVDGLDTKYRLMPDGVVMMKDIHGMDTVSIVGWQAYEGGKWGDTKYVKDEALYFRADDNPAVGETKSNWRGRSVGHVVYQGHGQLYFFNSKGVQKVIEAGEMTAYPEPLAQHLQLQMPGGEAKTFSKPDRDLTLLVDAMLGEASCMAKSSKCAFRCFYDPDKDVCGPTPFCQKAAEAYLAFLCLGVFFFWCVCVFFFGGGGGAVILAGGAPEQGQKQPCQTQVSPLKLNAVPPILTNPSVSIWGCSPPDVRWRRARPRASWRLSGSSRSARPWAHRRRRPFQKRFSMGSTQWNAKLRCCGITRGLSNHCDFGNLPMGGPT